MEGMASVALFLVVFFVRSVISVDWDYSGAGGPSHWSTLFPTCGGRYQSPVDIVPGEAPQGAHLGPLGFSGYDDVSKPFDYELTNDGHTVQLNVLTDSRRMTLSGGGLTSQYDLVQFHFHWGNSSSGGAEHTLNGKRYPAELHLVHYNTKYGNSSQAMSHSDGIAVLGVYVDVGPEDHPVMTKLISYYSTLKYSGTTVPVNDTFSMKGMLPDNVKDYYRYKGSLTTPKCLEVVTWSVLRDPLRVSHGQMNAFRSLLVNKQGESPDRILQNNYRPTQQLNGRTIYRSN